MRYLTDPANRPLIDENLGITARDARGCVTDPAAVETYDPRAALHFVTAGPPDPHRAPPLSVFVTWRDSTRGLVESARRVTNQSYAALRWYETQYKQAPKVIFLVQSFGGLATRFILSNPPADVFDTPLLNADRIPICSEEHTKMDYLRDRTVFALTLATPHEGSYMAEWGSRRKTSSGPRSPTSRVRSAVPTPSPGSCARSTPICRSSSAIRLVSLPAPASSWRGSIASSTARRCATCGSRRCGRSTWGPYPPSAPAAPAARRSRARATRSSRSTRLSGVPRAAAPSTRRNSSRASIATRPSARRRRAGSSTRCSSPTCS